MSTMSSTVSLRTSFLDCVRVGRAGARPPRSADGFERGLEAAGVGLRAFELGHSWFCSFGLFGCLRAVVATTAEDHLHRVDGEVFAIATRHAQAVELDGQVAHAAARAAYEVMMRVFHVGIDAQRA